MRPDMSNRDEFSPKTKTAVAARAGYRCSFTGCGKTTIGPSEESSEAVTMIGKAAHIAGAAPGRGSRRYLPEPTMTPETRMSIDNAIWLCANHADLIDRDEVTYTIEKLQAMKRAHEALQATAVRDGMNHDLGAGLLAIGPDVVCIGDIDNISTTSWKLLLRHFVIGDVHNVVTLIDGFTECAAQDRYVLCNELGDGRLLSGPPSLTKQDNGYSLLCHIEPGCSRIDAQNLGSSFALHPDTNDLYIKNGSIACVAGVEYLPQKIQSLLSVQRDEDVFHPDFGMRFFEYFEEFKGSPLLDWLFKLDVVRQASIPFTDGVLKRQYPPLQCVTRVRNVELLSETPTNNRLPIRVDLEVQGLGSWVRELSIYMPTKEQMTKRAELIAKRPL
jgi:hypothetical protein